MTPEQIKQVQTTFDMVEPIADKAAELFYGRLFEIAPEVRPMFKSDISEQGAKLMRMLGIAVRGLTKLDTIVPAVQNLGVKHLEYGVKEEHFQPVAEALLWTLEQGLGDAWNDEVKASWTEAYVLLSTTMIDAMKAAQAEAAPKPEGFWAKLKSFFAPSPA
ncbi:globin family protein [Ketobacter sp.]|uniref:globin family protein n=1 Tax=Ketobacter sp. TaxID=2083498 RepID=UPI000F1B3B4E|nr:globin family protein [Ketobacter sp.]RLT93236.1 MAG: hemin receptor [Ketobacter sp.]